MTLTQSAVSPCPNYFNSHPHKEDDMPLIPVTTMTYHFNSHPHKEDDDAAKTARKKLHISTHILTRRMTSVPSSMIPVSKSFQLTSSQGGWQAAGDSKESWSAFQLTSSQGGWRRCIWDAHVLRLYFNSHPHKEDDVFPVSNFTRAYGFQLTSSQGGWRSCRNMTHWK